MENMRKQWFKRSIGLLLALVLVCSAVPGVGAADSPIALGTCGAELKWSLSKDGTLTISGTGAINESIMKFAASAYNYLGGTK